MRAAELGSIPSGALSGLSHISTVTRLSRDKDRRQTEKWADRHRGKKTRIDRQAGRDGKTD